MAGFQKAVRLNALWVLLCATAVSLGGEAGLDLGGDTAARPPKPEISVSQRSVAAGQVFEIIADFKLDKTVKLYRDELRFEWTTLEGASLKEVVFPVAERVPDPLAEDENKTIEIYHGQVRLVAKLLATAKPGRPIVVAGSLYHRSCTDTICFIPAEKPFRFELTTTGAAGGPAPPVQEVEPAAGPPIGQTGQVQERPSNLLLQILGSFWIGVLLSLTPCVYPMIPVTAAVIGARRERGLAKALFASATYVMGLAIVYALVGLITAMFVKDTASVQRFLHRPAVVIPISGVFAALAVVMFAGLNLSAPTGFATRLQGLLAGKKGVLSVFALGAVSGLVIGPCVTPVLYGLLTYVGTTGNPVLGFWMFFALAWGMGIPLVVFGTATGLLPKAGPWTGWFKKLLGFALLWGALYFLKPVTGALVYQKAFALLLVAAAVFLGGLDALARESSFADRLKKLLGVVAVFAAVLLFFSSGVPAQGVFKPAGAEEVERAIAEGRPVVLDFYADWCRACEVLERKVYTKPQAVEAAQGLAAFKVNVDREPGLVSRFKVPGPPTVVFIGRDGKEQADLRFVGEKSLDEFVKLLERFKGPAPER